MWNYHAESQIAQPPQNAPIKAIRKIFFIFTLIWEITESDFATFVLPNTAFGLAGALSRTLTESVSPPLSDIFRRAPLILLFNWYMVLVFDLANQRSPKSVAEDKINKPWRPIPQGRMTPDQARISMLICIPCTLIFNSLLSVWNEGILILVLSWMYNDLGGGDHILRNPIIAVGYGCFNRGSLQIALGPGATINFRGTLWIIMISGMIASTMHIQDLKDQEGDRKRGRQTIPLLIGDRACRWILALAMLLWAVSCASFWALPWWTYLSPCGLALYISASLMKEPQKNRDARSWRLWCLWCVGLYAMPVFHGLNEKLASLDWFLSIKESLGWGSLIK